MALAEGPAAAMARVAVEDAQRGGAGGEDESAAEAQKPTEEDFSYGDGLVAAEASNAYQVFNAFASHSTREGERMMTRNDFLRACVPVFRRERQEGRVPTCQSPGRQLQNGRPGSGAARRAVRLPPTVGLVLEAVVRSALPLRRALELPLALRGRCLLPPPLVLLLVPAPPLIGLAQPPLLFLLLPPPHLLVALTLLVLPQYEG